MDKRNHVKGFFFENDILYVAASLHIGNHQTKACIGGDECEFDSHIAIASNGVFEPEYQTECYSFESDHGIMEFAVGNLASQQTEFLTVANNTELNKVFCTPYFLFAALSECLPGLPLPGLAREKNFTPVRVQILISLSSNELQTATEQALAALPDLLRFSRFEKSFSIDIDFLCRNTRFCVEDQSKATDILSLYAESRTVLRKMKAS